MNIDYKLIIFSVELYKKYLSLKDYKDEQGKYFCYNAYNNYINFIEIFTKEQLEILNKYKDRDIEEFEAIMSLM